jgi:hypothetical protein
MPAQVNLEAKAIYEEAVEALQRRSCNVPYVTIIHAYSDRKPIRFEEVPSSPATPNTHGGNGYFDYETIFTHAAQVPDYHNPNRASITTLCTSKIAAPFSVDLSTLERYIPPTTTEEVRDFFSISRKSHLVDRLTELSKSNGTLLLVYPTRTGGRTFKKWYKDPVVDPLLRQFMMLHNLTMHACVALSRMVAIDSLMDFDDMQSTIETLCQTLGEQAPAMHRSRFRIMHAEQAEVILNRQTWIDLFLAQEGARMKQDLIDYQKSGLRMPAQGFKASPTALAREVEDGIRNSREAAGGVGIEVGVFVIRRLSL